MQIATPQTLPPRPLPGTHPYLFVSDFVHELQPLQRLPHRYAHILLRQGARPVGVVEVEQALVTLHAKEGRNVGVIGQRS